MSNLLRLLGNKLSMHMNPPSVRAVILSESQAQEVDEGPSRGDNTGEILNATSVMEFNPSTGVLSANFRNMSLK